MYCFSPNTLKQEKEQKSIYWNAKSKAVMLFIDEYNSQRILFKSIGPGKKHRQRSHRKCGWMEMRIMLFNKMWTMRPNVHCERNANQAHRINYKENARSSTMRRTLKYGFVEMMKSKMHLRKNLAVCWQRHMLYTHAHTFAHTSKHQTIQHVKLGDENEWKMFIRSSRLLFLFVHDARLFDEIEASVRFNPFGC